MGNDQGPRESRQDHLLDLAIDGRGRVPGGQGGDHRRGQGCGRGHARHVGWTREGGGVNSISASIRRPRAAAAAAIVGEGRCRWCRARNDGPNPDHVRIDFLGRPGGNLAGGTRGHQANARGRLFADHRGRRGCEPTMNDLRRALMQIVYINKAFIRSPIAAFFTLVFPIMFLVIFSVLFGNGKMQVARAVTISLATFYVPAIAAFSVVTACYTNIAISLSIARDSGALKRIRGSPLPVWAYMFAKITHSALISVSSVAVCSAFGAVFYGATLPTTTLAAFLLP